MAANAKEAKLKRLVIYVHMVKNLLDSATTPQKHLKHRESYRAFLKKELELAQRQIDALKGV